MAVACAARNHVRARLNNWHLENSIKYCGPFHPEYSKTPVPISVAHDGLHDATLDFKTAVRGIVPGYAGHVPRARDMYGTPASGGITPERGWKRTERTGQMLQRTNLGPMGDRAFAGGPTGAASRPHAYSRRHNLVSDEIKPGFAGHVPLARDTYGTSHYRDAFTHRTGLSAHKELEDGGGAGTEESHALRSGRPLGERGTSSLRFFSRSQQMQQPRAQTATPQQRPPGLTARERLAGRPVSARASFTSGRYFALPISRSRRAACPSRLTRQQPAATPRSGRWMPMAPRWTPAVRRVTSGSGVSTFISTFM